MSTPYFSGVKYSPATSMFYTFKKDVLHRWNPAQGNVWAISDYTDINGNSKNWVKPSPKQLELLEEKELI